VFSSLRQPIQIRIAVYEDVNDAERL